MTNPPPVPEVTEAIAKWADEIEAGTSPRAVAAAMRRSIAMRSAEQHSTATLSEENAALRDALTDIASTDRAFVEAQGGDNAAICAIIEHARDALSRIGNSDAE